MTTNGDSECDTLLGRYSAGGEDRELYAIRVPGEQTFTIIDLLANRRTEEGELDERHVEQHVGGLAEARAIAADYIALAERLGWPPMPDVWW